MPSKPRQPSSSRAPKAYSGPAGRNRGALTMTIRRRISPSASTTCGRGGAGHYVRPTAAAASSITGPGRRFSVITLPKTLSAPFPPHPPPSSVSFPPLVGLGWCTARMRLGRSAGLGLEAAAGCKSYTSDNNTFVITTAGRKSDPVARHQQHEQYWSMQKSRVRRSRTQVSSTHACAHESVASIVCVP